MMCEECGVRPAKFHLMTIINGDRVERNLCPNCMAKHQKQLPGIDFSNLAGILNSILAGKDEEEQARQDAEYESCVCEQCGRSLREYDNDAGNLSLERIESFMSATGLTLEDLTHF